VDEPNDGTEYPGSESSLAPVTRPESGIDETSVRPIPRHAAEAAETYTAQLDELLAHLATHPDERWVAYRGRLRIGFGTDDGALHRACLVRYPDGEFCVYGIDGALKYPDDTAL
jgi:hypothetical protein